jgi:hypothetical protein
LKHEFLEEKIGKLEGNSFFCATRLLDAIAFRYTPERSFITNHVIGNSAFRRLFQKEDKMAAVVGVRGRSPGHFAEKIAGHNRVCIRTADAARGLIRNAAGAHVADPAAEAFSAEPAGGLLGIQAGEAGVYAVPLRLDQCFQRRLVPDAIFRFYYFFCHQKKLIQNTKVKMQRAK